MFKPKLNSREHNQNYIDESYFVNENKTNKAENLKQNLCSIYPSKYKIQYDAYEAEEI